jgi:uncharacterized protein
VTYELSSYALGAVAAFLMGLSKTGLPSVSILGVVLMVEAFPGDARASVGAVMPAILVGDLIGVYWYRRHADWRRLVELCPWVALGFIPAVIVLHAAVGNQLKPLLGWLVLVLLILELTRQRLGLDQMPHQGWFVVSTGLVAGFGTMVGNAAGPVMGIYLVAHEMPKQLFVGTTAWFFFIVNLSKLPIMTWLGMANPDTLRFGVTVAPASVLGALLGMWAVRVIPQKPFEWLTLALAGLAALRLVAM